MSHSIRRCGGSDNHHTRHLLGRFASCRFAQHGTGTWLLAVFAALLLMAGLVACAQPGAASGGQQDADQASLVASLEPDDYPGGGPLDAAKVEWWVVSFTNVERNKAGLNPLKRDTALSDVARQHSEQMILYGLQHTIEGNKAMGRAKAAGYDCSYRRSDGSRRFSIRENIGMYPRVQHWQGERTLWGSTEWTPTRFYQDEEEAGRAMVEGWMDSPGHRVNMLADGHYHIGVGVAIRVFVGDDGRVHETLYSAQNFPAC
jgi:uncharacterized protein YkwD